MAQFSIIVLTYNEEIHLPRLLNSVSEFNAPIYVLDSGSTDKTLDIAEDYGALILVNEFRNHPLQWDFALKNFNINTSWTIGLDADQIVSTQLKNKLNNLSQIEDDIQGIYFNRKNIFKGRWIRYGGYFPKYLLKMFRTGVGYSDLNEMMDHKFVVNGKTIVWEDGYLIEENLKENDISFWINKHNRYSDLVALQEFNLLKQEKKAPAIKNLNANPDHKIKYYKSIWQQLPLFLRPFLYFLYRYFLRLGFLDGREGLIFHFMQALWFRFIVDIKIYQLTKNYKVIKKKHVHIGD